MQRAGRQYYFLCKKSGILRDLGSTVLVILVGLFSERGLVADDVAGWLSEAGVPIGVIVGCTGVTGVTTVCTGVVCATAAGAGAGVGLAAV